MPGFLSLSLPAILVISLAFLLGAVETGRWLARRGADGRDETLATLEAAVLGLLALMISFTFAMALNRFDARRDGILQEANAIGTTALRARLLPAPHGAETLDLLRAYTNSRIELGRTVPTEASLKAGLARAGELHEALWRQAMAAAAKDNGMVPTGLFIQALNQLIDMHEVRLTAYRSRVPPVVFGSLYGIAIVAMGFTGYAAGRGGGQSRAPGAVMAMLIAGVILMIQDLDRPGAGFIQASLLPLIDTAASIASFVK